MRNVKNHYVLLNNPSSFMKMLVQTPDNKTRNAIFKRTQTVPVTSSQYFTYKIAIRDMCTSVQCDSSLLYKPIARYIYMYTSMIKRLFHMEKILKVQTPI